MVVARRNHEGKVDARHSVGVAGAVRRDKEGDEENRVALKRGMMPSLLRPVYAAFTEECS
jgi:hypothetical protein